MASDGTRVFVLGGTSWPAGTRAAEPKLIHVLDTSMPFLFVISFEQPSILKVQSAFITRNPTPTMPILVRRPSNLRGNHPRVL